MQTNPQAVKSQKKRKIIKYDKKKYIHLKTKLKQDNYQEHHTEAHHNQIIKN